MASIFKKIGNFLNRDEVRAGLALGSVAGGFGAFDGMKYGDTINKTLGGLNLASGFKAGGASGALQAGLGGYGLAQGFGKVGTFGNTYDSLMGNQQPSMTQANRNTFLNTVRGGNGNTVVSRQTLPSMNAGMNYGSNEEFKPAGLFLPTSDGQMGEGSGKYLNTAGAFNAPPSSTAMNNQYLNTAGQMSVPNTNVSNGYGQMANNNTGSRFTPNVSTGGGQMDNNNSGLRLNPNPNPTSPSNFNIADLTNTNGQDIYPSGNVSAPGFYPNTGVGNNQGSTAFKDITFEKVFDNIVNKAMKDPLQAVAVGSALVTAFADDPAEEAAKQYAAEMARVRAQTDPNSDFGQNYIQSFSERRTTELDDAYSKATSDFVATMSKRGMMDSTIFTEGKASLDQRFAELKAKIPMDSQIALQDYQKAQLTNLNLGSQAAYRGGALTAGVTNPFTNAFKASVASTKA
tara:strand:- start:1505 stop:2878 length:1374 start_codon:yes stop_codon:yes gene_type:complete